MTRPDGGKSAAKASRSSVYLSSSQDVEGISGKYFDANSRLVDWPPAVLGTDIRKKLWETVERLAHIA
jgi:hypothetical protein